MRILTLSVLASALLSLPAAAQTIDRIKQTAELRLGFRTDAAPLSYRDQAGSPAGYAPQVCVGVAQAIANTLKLENLNVQFIPVDAGNRFDKITEGEIDLLCGAATITLSRRQAVDFSVPIYVDGTAVILPKAAGGNLADLAGKKLAVRSDTTTQETLGNSLQAAKIEAEVVAFETHNAALEALTTGAVNAYFADQSILLGFFASGQIPDTFMLSDEILTIEKQGLAMRRGDSDFRLLVDTALSGMFAQGAMGQIFEKSLPGAQPGAAIQAMSLMSPTLP